MKPFNKELKRLGRRELVDIIYQMKKNEEQMQNEIIALQEVLQDKRIRLSNAGSIASAAVEITQVFSVAQKTADMYLQEIACMKEETERTCKKMIEEASEKTNHIYAEGKKQYDLLEQKKKLLLEEIKKLEQQNHDLCEGMKC